VRIEWRRAAGRLPEGRSRDDSRGLLVITDVRAEDAGLYVCTATDGVFVYTDQAELNVDNNAGGGGGGGRRPGGKRPNFD